MNKKMYRANYNVVLTMLSEVFLEGKYSHKLIEKEFKYNKKLGSRDRKFIAENVYEMVRWWKLIEYSCEIKQTTEASVEKAVTFWFYLQGYAPADFLNFESYPCGRYKKNWKSQKKSFAIKHSLSEQGAQLLQDNFSEESEQVAKELNKKAPIYLRANLKNTSRQTLLQQLKTEELEVKADSQVNSCIEVLKRSNVFKTESFKKGDFEVQDKGSQLIAPFLKIEPGQLVIDACAGAGGKSLHLADMMGNKGRILSLDIHEWKLKELKRRAKRNRVDNIEVRLISSSKVIKRLEKKADRLLLDVPCSGYGVLKRNPDTKWKFNLKTLNELLILQQDILKRYSKMVKVDGYMVYATCSIFSCENQQQVEIFLKDNAAWELEEERLLLPTEMNSDGFYMARIKKISE